MKNLILTILAAVFLTACVKDDTVHDFNALEELTISGLQDSYDFNYLEDVTIAPQITTTIQDESTLEYRWYMYTSTSQFIADTLSREKVITANISATPGLDYKFVFSVKDTNTGIVYKKNMTAEVFGEFTKGILLLCDQDGQADINFLRPDESLLTNVFTKANPETSLGNSPRKIIVVDPSQFKPQLKNIYVSALDSDGGVILNPITMKLEKRLREAFYDSPISEVLDLQNYTLGGLSDYLIVNGQVHNRAISVGDPIWRPELIITNTSIETDYYMHNQIINGDVLGSSVPVFHDDLHGRFLQHSPTNKGALQGYTGGSKDGFDYDNTNVEMIFASITVLPTGYQGRYYYAICKGKTDSKRYLMKFLVGRRAIIGPLEFHAEELTEIPVSEFPGLYNATHFDADFSMPSVLWYSDGDKLYAMNVSAASPVEITVSDFGTQGMFIDNMKVFENIDDNNNPFTEMVLAFRDTNQTTQPAGLLFYTASTTGGININETKRLNNLADKIIDFDFKDN